MARFLALYIGSTEKPEGKLDAATEQNGMEAWGEWAKDHSGSIVDQGAPLGKSLKVNKHGVSSTKNLVTGYVVVEASSHQEAAVIFEGHPHFSVFSDANSVEIIECLELPTS